ncbi:MAG: transposase [Pseudarcicella sp.]|nr:transposase [Pseudarcicella sp.]
MQAIHYNNQSLSNQIELFYNRSTNASKEYFNAKIKTFRAKFRGMGNIEFLLFRLTNIYA